jgi:glutathione synthase/RimK-type ligase-like ATP-grasp enzyme
MKRTILIVGQIPDSHIRAVVAALVRHRCVKVIVFDRLQPESYGLDYRFQPEVCNGFVRVGDEWCNLADVSAVWWRVKPFTLSDMTGAPASPMAGFAQREWRSALDSLEAFTPQALWVNRREADLRARNKPIQLRIAHEVGFAIPPTVISNDPSSVARFLTAGEDEHVYKVLTWYFEPPDRIIFTSIVEAAQVVSDPEAVNEVPGIFQSRIPKDYEVRATVVGDDVFSIRVDSQALEDTKLDWRRNQRSLSYAQHELPEATEELLRIMNHRLGLVYGAYDLIVTPSGQYVFLEVNPVGQWLWLENATGLPISQALASFLLGSGNDAV